MPKRKPKRLCRICGKPERISRRLGIPVSNMLPSLQVCVDCVNRGALDDPNFKEDQRAVRERLV